MAETEAVLLRRFAGAGDAEAFAEIIRRHAGMVYGAALRVVADVDRASDIAQETFLQLMKEAGNVTDSLPGWLHRVATRKAIDLIRRDATRKSREIRHARETPQEVEEWREISPFVDAELASLLPELRDVLVGHFLEGRSTREIAANQGVSQATVSRRLDAGVKLLRARLRRRGIIVAAGLLSLLLGQNAAEAAPPLLMAELGKMALFGGAAASTAGGGSAFSGIITSLTSAAKCKTAAIVAVAAIGVGAVATYEVANRPEGPTAAAVRSASYEPYPPLLSAASARSSLAQTAPDWNAFMGLAERQTTLADAGSVRRGVGTPGIVRPTNLREGGMGGVPDDYAQRREDLAQRETGSAEGSEPNDSNDKDANAVDANATSHNLPDKSRGDGPQFR